jgi:hypothetical protein
MKIILFLLLGIVFVLEVPSNAVPCDSLGMNTAPIPAQTKVSIDIFSGREAPTWSLSATEVKTLIPMIDTLPITDTVKFRDDLGYRGITVNLPDPVSGSISTLKVYNGVIQYDTGSKTKFFTDTDRHIERWLLVSGKPHIPPDLYIMVERESKLSH